MNKGYWQVKLHSDSRKLTYMALDIGGFQWKRLSIGTIIASDVLEEIGLYIGLPGSYRNSR